MANYYRKQGKTLADRLDELYAEFGAYRNTVESFAFEGSAGMDTMRGIMEKLRENPPAEVLGRKLILVNDYKKSESVSADGKREVINLPKSNVLKFVYEGGLGIIARPSGTEPKLKIYYTIKAENMQAAEALWQKLSGKNGAFASVALN
jgi:phosphoglucomutase